MQYRHIFGPVPSRRLGISLGVDLVHHKVCTLDCIYCECGRTTDLTLDRSGLADPLRIKAELDHYFSQNDDPDYITFSGSGEPSLNPHLGEIIRYIRTLRPGVRVAVLTNGTLLFHPDVRNAMLQAHRVIPSLDAADRRTFEQINRPCNGLEIESVIEGLAAFSSQYEGELFLEIFILPGVNDHPESLEAICGAVRQIRPDRVQLNTLDRPGTVSDLKPASKTALERVMALLDFVPCDIIARVSQATRTRTARADIDAAILETVHRRPCTAADLERITGLDEKTLIQTLRRLEMDGRIKGSRQARGVFYQTVKETDI